MGLGRFLPLNCFSEIDIKLRAGYSKNCAENCSCFIVQEVKYKPPSRSRSHVAFSICLTFKLLDIYLVEVNVRRGRANFDPNCSGTVQIREGFGPVPL